jgi:hypothetical protein
MVVKLFALGLMIGFILTLLLIPVLGPGIEILKFIVGYYVLVMVLEEVGERCWSTV